MSKDLIPTPPGLSTSTVSELYPGRFAGSQIPYGFVPEEATVPLGHYLWILRRNWWKILAFVTLCVTGAFVYSARTVRMYESIATLDVDRQTPTGVVGQEALQNGLLYDTDQFLATQVKTIQSDSVVRPVAQRFQIGAFANESSTPDKLSGTVSLYGLSVVRPTNTYLLQISYRSPDPQLSANVANAVAESYLKHTYDVRIESSIALSTFMEKQLEGLRAKMETSGAKVAAFERELNVINPEQKADMLSGRLVQLNTEYTNAQADRIRKEAAFNNMKAGSLEAAQVSTQGEALKSLTERLNMAQEKFAELKAQLGPNHPDYKRAAAQISELSKQIADTRANTTRRVELEYDQAVGREVMVRKAVVEAKDEFDKVNGRSYQYEQLKQEAEGDKKLYDELLRKIREAGINAGFQNSAVRLTDPARPSFTPVTPNMTLNVGLAFLGGLLIAVLIAILTDRLDHTVWDPDSIARLVRPVVIGMVPKVNAFRKNPLIAGGAGADAIDDKALAPLRSRTKAGRDQFAQSMQALRASILLSNFDRQLRSLVITSSVSGEGKSTVAAGLALAHAAQGRKTLLIEGDLRRPSLKNLLGVDKRQGLTDILALQKSWQDLVVHVEGNEYLDVLPAGAPSRRAADQIGHLIGAILDQAGRIYDLVIIDSPPLLGFAESLHMSTAADGVLVIAQGGRTDRKALASVCATLERVRANVIGIALNQSSGAAGGYGYYTLNSNYNYGQQGA